MVLDTLADMTVVAIDKIHSRNPCIRKVQECRLVRTLVTSLYLQSRFPVKPVQLPSLDLEDLFCSLDIKAIAYTVAWANKLLRNYGDYKYNVYIVSHVCSTHGRSPKEGCNMLVENQLMRNALTGTCKNQTGKEKRDNPARTRPVAA